MRAYPALLPLLSFLLVGLAGCLPTGPGTARHTSPPFTVDRYLAPLAAPAQGSKVMLIENQPGELVWLTGVSIKAEDLELERLAPRFVGDCTVDFQWPDWHNEKLATRQPARLFSLGQGLYSFQLPEGFGIPLYSNEPLLWNYRVCNLSAYQKPTRVQVKSELRFVRDRGLDPPCIPLMVKNFPILHRGQPQWTVPPGKKVVAASLNDLLDLRIDRFLHGLTVALHPHAVGFQIIDRTEGKPVLTLLNQGSRKDGSLRRVESYSSKSGLLLKAEHRYRGVVHYLNESNSPKQGVAYVTAYLYDPEFSKYNTAR